MSKKKLINFFKERDYRRVTAPNDLRFDTFVARFAPGRPCSPRAAGLYNIQRNAIIIEQFLRR